MSFHHASSQFWSQTSIETNPVENSPTGQRNFLEKFVGTRVMNPIQRRLITRSELQHHRGAALQHRCTGYRIDDPVRAEDLGGGAFGPTGSWGREAAVLGSTAARTPFSQRERVGAAPTQTPCTSNPSLSSTASATKPGCNVPSEAPYPIAPAGVDVRARTDRKSVV